MNKCNLVGDLLPQYAEGLLSEDGKKFVENHLARCTACAEKAKKLMAPVEVEEAPAPPSEESKRSLKGVQKKFRRRSRVIAAVAVCLSAIIVFCAVFFPMRLKEVRDILYPYGIDGQPTDLDSIWTYPTDSMIKLGKPIETFTQEPSEEGYPFTPPHSPDKTPPFTLILPEPYQDIIMSSAYAVKLENAAILVREWDSSHAFQRVFGVSPDDVDVDRPDIKPVAVYCKEHSLTTWTQIADYAINYRKSEFSLLFSPNSAAKYTANIFNVRDRIIDSWVQKGETYCPQVYHPFRGAFEGYAFSHEGAAGSWKVCVMTEQHVYEISIFGVEASPFPLEGEKILFPDEESIADLLSTATFV